MNVPLLIATNSASLVVGGALALFGDRLRRHGELSARRADAARELAEVAASILGGEAGKNRDVWLERVRRATTAARMFGSKDIRAASELLAAAFVRDEQPPGNYMGLKSLTSAIDFVAACDCDPGLRRRSRKEYRVATEMIHRERANFVNIANVQHLDRLFGLK